MKNSRFCKIKYSLRYQDNLYFTIPIKIPTNYIKWRGFLSIIESELTLVSQKLR